MFLILLWIPAVVSVPALSKATLPPPPPPENIHVEKWLLTWAPTSEESNITYTVQYQSFDTSVWKDVPACIHTSFTSCNVAFSKAESDHGCVMLRVRAERHGLNSTSVQACSRHGDSCSPDVSLTARPRFLTVYLSQNHSLVQEHGGNMKHRVYYSKEGEPLKQQFVDSVSSVSIGGLEEGQRYCTRVQFLYFNKPMGPESCTQCEVIPRSKHEPVQADVIVAVVFMVVLVPSLVMAYILICHRGKIKQWLQPPNEIPSSLTDLHTEPHILRSPGEERCDVISLIRP